MYAALAAKLAAGDPIILDGGTGTDIQRRGVPMDGQSWCAEANLTHPEIVRAVHEDYVRAGAEVITANSFATSALLFNHLGRDDDVLRIDRAAVAIARQAAAGHRVAVAGSMSTMRPVAAGSDRNNNAIEWPEATARALFAAKAKGLKDSGADLIMMELLRDGDYAVWATEAALATGLPVWVGVSAERNDQGELVGWGRPDWSLDDIVARLAALKPAVISVMHSSANDTGPALEVVRRHWRGPLGTYPESGYFKMPDWQFVDIITPAELVAQSRGWRRLGASLFGGCCGIGPDHIAALAKEFAA
jgi:homocysteine S-methyltransferase